MKYIEYGTTSMGEKIYARVDDDDLIRFTCLEENPEYQAWLNEASTL